MGDPLIDLGILLCYWALSLGDDKLLSVLGVLYNTNITTIQARNGELRLFGLNATLHLPDSLRTFR